MADDTIDFDQNNNQEDATEQSDATPTPTISRIASLNAKAVMPDGKTFSRAEILQSLGLNPGTSPTAWLAILGCGSNASALLPGDLQRIAANRVASAATVLNRLGNLATGTTGFASGGGSNR